MTNVELTAHYNNVQFQHFKVCLVLFLKCHTYLLMPSTLTYILFMDTATETLTKRAENMLDDFQIEGVQIKRFL